MGVAAAAVANGLATVLHCIAAAACQCCTACQTCKLYLLFKSCCSSCCFQVTLACCNEVLCILCCMGRCRAADWPELHIPPQAPECTRLVNVPPALYTSTSLTKSRGSLALSRGAVLIPSRIILSTSDLPCEADVLHSSLDQMSMDVTGQIWSV